MRTAGHRLFDLPLRRSACALLFLLGCCSGIGCALLSASPEMITQNYSTQQTELYEICPKGTPRPQAIAALEAAGIVGEFGTNQSIYYCDAWNREDGQVWEMDLALLFNEEGELYSTMPGRTRVTSVTQE